MKIINLKDMDINNIEIPKEPFRCFFICEETMDNSELLEKLIYNGVRELHFHGMWSIIWENKADEICVKYEQTHKVDSSNVVLTSSEDLANFIVWCSLVEEDAADNRILFYDDEDLKNFVVMRVNEINSKDGQPKNRIELCCYSNMSKEKGVSPVADLVEAASHSDIAGIAITDTMSVQAYKQAQSALKKAPWPIRLIYGCELDYGFDEKVHILCKNNEAKRKLYDILTEFYTNDNASKLDVLRDNVENNRDLFVKGCYSLNTNIIKHALTGDVEKLSKEMENYDYIEVAPVNIYNLHLDIPKEEIKKAIKLIIDESLKKDIPVVAVNIVCYASRKQLLSHKIYETKDLNLVEFENSCPDYYGIDQSLISTDEMKYLFYWLNDYQLIEDIVVNNTHIIANMCDDFEPFDDSQHLPNIDNAYDAIEKHAYAELYARYGKNPDSLILDRLKDELAIIKNNNYASIFYIVCGLCALAKQDTSTTSFRGSIGTSLVAYLLGISECNPLPPHYVCPNCHKAIWQFSYDDGFDLPNKTCECGTKMLKDGHNLHYEIFMGPDGKKIPDIDLNFDSDFCDNIPEYLKELAPHNRIIKPGIIKHLWYSDATKIVNNYAGEDEGVFDYSTKSDIANELCNITLGNDVKKGAYIFIPNNVDINDYTPLMKIDGQTCAHNEYYEITKNFYKQDCLESTDLYVYSILGMNGIYLEDIDILDQEIYETIKGHKDYGLLGISEFNNEFANNLYNKIKPSKFSELIKVSSLSHSTNVWINNQDELYDKGLKLKDIVASRDDVMDVLLEHDVNIKDAYEIMEYVRKGKANRYGFTDEQISILKEHGLSDEFINVCKSILYMFPKAHCIIYLINTLRFIWLKIHKPLYFYAQWFAYRSKINILNQTVKQINERINNFTNEEKETFKIDLQLINEMNNRGIYFIDNGLSDGNEKIELETNHNNKDKLIFFSKLVSNDKNTQI